MEFDLRHYVRVLLKRKWYVLTALVCSIGVAVVLTANTVPVYAANSSLFVGQRQVSVGEVRSGVELSNLSSRLLQSYAQIIQSRSMAERAVSEGGLSLSPGQVRGGLLAAPVPGTQVIKLTFFANDPAIAERVTNAVAKAFVSEIDSLESSDVPGAQPAIRVSIIDPAVAPGAPLAPNPARNVALAIVIGLALGVGVAFLIDHLDVSVKNREELERAGIPVIGTIPSLDTHGEEVYLERDTQGIGGEAFRKLRTSVGFLGVDVSVKTILVTSPIAQEGKTTVALNVAMAYALGGFRTLLLEADLRRPSLHRIFGMQGTRGLTTAVVGQVSVSDAIFHTQTRNFSVLMAGAIPPNPVELLASEQMTEVMLQLRQMFDIVIVDSPPLVPVADPAALAARCDGVIIVVRAGKTDRRRLVDGIKIIDRAGGRVLGVALNFLRPSDSPDDYDYYYYGYRSQDSPVEGAESAQRHA